MVTELTYSPLLILVLSYFFGILGSLLGLGGALFLTPVLTIFMGVPIHYAIGAGFISIIATSSGSAAAYVRDRISNIRVGMFLEIATTVGAITGAYLSGLISNQLLFIVFSGMMFFSAYMMFRNRHVEFVENAEEDALAEKLQLSGHYVDKALHRDIAYKTQKPLQGLGLMFVAGILSGLLGIGNGALKVLAMDQIMKMPVKVSSATSNFMMGVTAAASAGVFFARGDIHPAIAAPVALGMMLGAMTGSRIMNRLRAKTLRTIFVPILLLIAAQMFLKGLGVL
ncbi:TSUP family transporter [Heliobacterium gestii]|uniref:Probable membrane transporter protein n=1 Tax=Heliomicrobium gestii TaxID=2699 RepID=A0A845LBT6_HELGE|nr:sulfite exporter TauE/SafE family protein [Heliomicrobium gestii]MBM7867372.1 putative membrane protein YfcA [Heliomicrobium gestii]MZP43638.1 TSUP family transporter [Heliomicrobium gestii]